MFDLLGQDETFRMLESTMDLLSTRHTLISSNIANVDTPGYKAVDISFQKELQIAISRNNSFEFGSGPSGSFSYRTVLKPRVFMRENVAARLDGNTVDIDKEMGALAKISGMYAQATTIMGMRLRMLNDAIKA